MATVELIKNEYGARKQEKQTTYSLTFADVYAMTLRKHELSKLGLSDNILFNMLLSHKKLIGKKLVIAELSKFDKPIKSNW